MANIAEFLQKILSARYGEEVRKSIHDAIKEIDNVADGARDSATNAASQAQEHARKAEESAENAKEAATKAEDISAEITDVKQQVQTVVEKTQEAVDAAGTATAKADETLLSAQLAAGKAQDAKNAAMSANNSAQNASASETNARNSEENAGDYWRISKSYAVGDTGEREGEDTDNSKYYCEQSAEHARRAEEAAEKAISISDISIATNDKAGLVKPDGETIRIDEDGTIHADAGTVDYIELENKPKINGVELSGDKSFEELGFEGTKDYSVLENKPTINGTELNGDKTLEELGIASAEELDKTTQKVDTIIEKADLGIKETASGENIHLTDSAESKVVEFALYGKATQDGEPTPENPVDIVVSGESYNLLENTASSLEKNGVTFTVNEDKSITVNGTATASTQFNIIGLSDFLKKGDYILSGCPSDGGEEKYRIDIRKFNENTIAKDTGNAKRFTITEDVEYKVLIRIGSGVTLNNLTFKPMIRKASVKNDRYMPYGVGSVEVKSVGKNLIDYPYTNTTKTLNGITFTDNNGIITANGTATANSDFHIKSRTSSKYSLPSGEYILSGCPSGGADNKYLLGTNYTDASGSGVGLATDYGNGAKFTIKDDTLGKDCYIGMFITIKSGTKVENLVFKPMVRLATDTEKYEQYREPSIFTIPTDGLAGILVSSGGNYTDQSGQQWICDEIVKYADGSGEYIQKVDKCKLNENSVISRESVVDGKGGRINLGQLTNALFIANNATPFLLCSHYKSVSADGTFKREQGVCINSNKLILAWDDRYVSGLDEYKAWIKENPILLYYVLAEPIRTPLTAEQIAEIEKVSTFYPVTNISNDFDCGMRVKYLADSKNYIDNQLALQAQAREQEMMAMFMLLPEETQAAMIENDINNLLLESEV